MDRLREVGSAADTSYIYKRLGNDAVIVEKAEAGRHRRAVEARGAEGPTDRTRSRAAGDSAAAVADNTAGEDHIDVYADSVIDLKEYLWG